MSAVTIEVLGPARLRDVDGALIPLTSHERRLVAGLALAGRDGLTPEALIAVVWPAGPPRTARQSLHNHIHRVRAKAGAELIGWRDETYRLATTTTTDVARMVELAALARSAMDRGVPAAALDLLVTIRSWFRGPPFTDVVELGPLEGERARIVEMREEVDDLHVRALMGVGRTDAAVAELERLLAREPDREGRWTLLLTALSAQGRRTDALDAYQRARRTLIDRHGMEPGPGLQSLQHELLQDPPGPASGPRRTAEVVGRDDVVAELVTTLREHGRAWLHGEAGIGKSSVLSLLTAAWTSGEVLLVACTANPWTALGPISALMEGLGRRLDRLGLPLTLDALTATDVPDQHLRRPGPLTQRAVTTIVTALTSEPGTLLLLDDIERAGPTTSAILGEVVRRSPQVAVLVTSRQVDEGLSGWGGDSPTIQLGGLDLQGLADLVRSMAGGPSDSEDRLGQLHALTAGHPMLAREIVLADQVPLERTPELAATDAHDRHPVAEGWEGTPDVPARLRTLLQARIDRLPSGARRALDAAAVMGQVLDVAVLRRIIDIGQLDPLHSAGILHTDHAGRPHFSHELFRRVAYEAVPHGRRTELHHALGQHSVAPARRARHLLAASDLDPHAAIVAATQAADRALTEQAYAEAALLYGQAATLAETVGMSRVEVLDLRLEAADAQRLAGLPGHAEPLLDIAEAVVGLDHVSLRRRATVAAVQLGEAVDPGPLQKRAARLAQQALHLESDAGWRARLSATSSQLHATAGNPTRCRTLLLEAIDLAGEDDQVIIDVHPFAYMALGHPDDLMRREVVADRLGLAATRVGSASAAWEAGHLRFSCALMRGDGAAARRHHTEMTALLSQVGDAPRRWSLAYQEAALAAIAGKLEDAEAMAEEALQIGQGVAPSRAMSAYSGQLFEIRRLQGRLDELSGAMTYLIEAQPEIAAWRAAGALVLTDTDPARSAALFDAMATDDFAALPRDFAWLAGMLSLGRAAVAHGDPEMAAAILPHLRPYADLVCWQGTCTFGTVPEVLMSLGALTDDQQTTAWAAQAEALTHTLQF